MWSKWKWKSRWSVFWLWKEWISTFFLVSGFHQHQQLIISSTEVTSLKANHSLHRSYLTDFLPPSGGKVTCPFSWENNFGKTTKMTSIHIPCKKVWQQPNIFQPEPVHSLTHASELTIEHITGKTGSLNHEAIHSPKQMKCLEKGTTQAILHTSETWPTSVTTNSIIQYTEHFHLSQRLVSRRLLLARIDATIPIAFCKKNSASRLHSWRNL